MARVVGGAADPLVDFFDGYVEAGGQCFPGAFLGALGFALFDEPEPVRGDVFPGLLGAEDHLLLCQPEFLSAFPHPSRDGW
jgi:hypothetical protein